MRESVPCLACGLELRAHFELFAHAPVCAVRQLDAMRERERRAKAETWQLEKRLNRLEKQVHRTVGNIGQGRAGVLAAKRVLESVKELVQPSRA